MPLGGRRRFGSAGCGGSRGLEKGRVVIAVEQTEKMIAQLAQELKVRPEHAAAVVQLLDEGNTVPFIARYRKEQHGTMDDQTIRMLSDRLNYLRGLENRRAEVKNSIEEQGKLTPELAGAIDAASTLAEVDDLYRRCV